MTYPNIIKYIVASLFLIQGSLLPAQAQEPRNPFDFPILLSANFGELRSNHFHSGHAYPSVLGGMATHYILTILTERQQSMAT